MKAAAIGILIASLLSGCVSVELGSDKTQKATGVKYSPPPAPFQQSAGTNVDAIWRNSKNGNAISFMSDCADTSDPSLQSIEQGVLSGIYPYTYQSQKDLSFEGRAARRIQVIGQVDGVESTVDLLIFKRNSCIYILSYVGLAQVHSENEKQFGDFTEGFHAP